MWTDALCPGGGVVQDLEVGITSEHPSIDGIVKGDIFGRALQRDIASRIQKAEDTGTLCQMLFVVPAVEIRFDVRRDVRPHCQQTFTLHSHPWPPPYPEDIC
jgi:hypothetical protein